MFGFRKRYARWQTKQIIKRRMADAHSVLGREEMLDWICGQLAVMDHSDGLVLEFGVGKGTSLRRLARCRYTYGFDTFTGLPEDWRENFPAGYFALSRDELVAVEAIENSEVVIGLFDDTLPDFLAQHPDEHISMAHVDCDLYSSTVTVLDNIASRVRSGTLILFDEYFNFPGWTADEHRALTESKSRLPDWEYVCYTTQDQQVAIRIK